MRDGVLTAERLRELCETHSREAPCKWCGSEHVAATNLYSCGSMFARSGSYQSDECKRLQKRNGKSNDPA